MQAEGRDLMIPDYWEAWTPATGVRWVSPQLPEGSYTLEVRVSDMKPNWTDKTRTQYGSTGYQVKITEIVYI